MARPTRTDDLASIVDIVRHSADGARRSEIAKALEGVPERTLQYWLKSLVDDGRLIQDGKGLAVRYRLPRAEEEPKGVAAPHVGTQEEKSEEADIPLSAESKTIRNYLRKPIGARKAVGYNRAFLDTLNPTLFLPLNE